MFAGFIALLLGIYGMSVLNNYAGRDFMTSIEHRDKVAFVRLALVYLGIFAGSILISVFSRVVEQRLELALARIHHKTYYRFLFSPGNRLEHSGSLENSDQRIAEDVRAFTATTLSFVVMILAIQDGGSWNRKILKLLNESVHP